MDGRDFRNFMEAFLQFAGKSWGRVYNYAWSIGMTIGPVVALVLLSDDPGSTSFVLTAIGLGIVIVGVLVRLQRIPGGSGLPLGPHGPRISSTSASRFQSHPLSI